MNIRELEMQGQSVRAIARSTGHSRYLVKKVLRGEHTMKIERTKRQSKLDPFKDHIKQRFNDYELSAVRLIEEAKQLGYTGSIQTVRRYLHSLKRDKEFKRRLTVRFETLPGKQAQVDWGYIGKFEKPDGTKISVYVFVMVLSYSRMMYLEFTTSMKMDQLIQSHQKAFDYFGGTTNVILYDNMKQIKTDSDRWNKQFLDFSDHYGFVLRAHKPMRPRTKGKVERLMSYIEDNFLAGRSFNGLADLEERGRIWVEKTANVRNHATTKQQPVVLFKEEKLNSLDMVKPYRYLPKTERKVCFEAKIHYEANTYSTPPEYAGRKVWVQNDNGRIIITAENTIIAEHLCPKGKGVCVEDVNHLEALWKTVDTQTSKPKKCRCTIRFTEEVKEASLSKYGELAQ